MADHVVSVDAGNGGTNAVLLKPNGVYKSVYFPSVRAAATGQSLGLGKGLELQYEYVDWGGHRYVVGDDVIRVTRRNLERHQGAFRYGDEFHQFLVAVALTKLGIKEGRVDLTLFAPPGMYVEAKRIMRERFLEKDGVVAIGVKKRKKPYIWHYESVTIWPEGIGAAACFALDENGEVLNSDVLTGETVILDMGVYTLDALKLVDGNFNPEALEHASWENGGISVHVLQPILRVLKKQSEDFTMLTVDDVDAVIRQGLTKHDYTLRVAGYEMDIEPLVNKYSQRYAEWVANNIVDGVFSGLRGIKSAILIGGGEPLTSKWLKKWYGGKILNRKDYDLVRRIHPVDMNAVGGLRMALMRQQQAQPT
jgi:hypothetical protein